MLNSFHVLWNQILTFPTWAVDCNSIFSGLGNLNQFQVFKQRLKTWKLTSLPSVSFYWGPLVLAMGFSDDASGKESICQCRRHKRGKFNPWVRKFPGGGNGNPLQYSCLWTEEHGGVQSMRSPRVGCDWAENSTVRDIGATETNKIKCSACPHVA